jgi:hypothetical protein
MNWMNPQQGSHVPIVKFLNFMEVFLVFLLTLIVRQRWQDNMWVTVAQAAVQKHEVSVYSSHSQLKGGTLDLKRDCLCSFEQLFMLFYEYIAD